MLPFPMGARSLVTNRPLRKLTSQSIFVPEYQLLLLLPVAYFLEMFNG